MKPGTTHDVTLPSIKNQCKNNFCMHFFLTYRKHNSDHHDTILAEYSSVCLLCSIKSVGTGIKRRKNFIRHQTSMLFRRAQYGTTEKNNRKTS